MEPNDNKKVEPKHPAKGEPERASLESANQARQIVSPARVQVPDMGRMVRYNHPGSADGKFPARQSPAMIQEVLSSDGLCRLFVFGPKGQHMDEVSYGDGPSQWSWPPIRG